MAAKDDKRTYTREELLAALQREGLAFSTASLRKAIHLGIIPRPCQVSAGRGKLCFEYSAASLAFARALALQMKQGTSVAEFKSALERKRPISVAEALDLVEAAVRIHACQPTSIFKHAVLAFEEVLLANRQAASHTQEWLAQLKRELCGIASLPSHNLRTSWLAWVSRARKELEARTLSEIAQSSDHGAKSFNAG